MTEEQKNLATDQADVNQTNHDSEAKSESEGRADVPVETPADASVEAPQEALVEQRDEPQPEAKAVIEILEIEPQEFFEIGDFVLFVGRSKRSEKEYLKRLDPERPIALKGENIPAGLVIGRPVGASLVTPLNQSYLMLKPTLAQRIMNMPRQAQILYPKDLALMIYWADVHPGSKVVEVGIGHGAMSMSLARAIGATGSLTSYEIRADFAKRTRKNAARYLGETPWWEIKLQNPVEEGIDETSVDSVIVDMPTPWELVPAVANALKPSGSATFFIPNVTQVIQLIDALVESRAFAQYKTMEAMIRPWRVSGFSVRPEMIISGHSGFIVHCRRKLGQTIKLTREECLPKK